jgi:superfamily II DNA or RNA helicase
LDEGINIPSIRSALILSSNDNYREFVQRRGRILRLYPGKTVAHIYDVIVLPSPYARGFAEIELRRYYEYCRLATNSKTLIAELEKLMVIYGLSYEDIKFNNTYVYGGDLDE